MDTQNFRQRKQEALAANKIKYEASSKERLAKNIEKKFNTTMIGALVSFEKYFGNLWGHDDDAARDDIDTEYYRELWEIVRTEILNNSNNQKRAANEEILQYTVTWNRYHTQFINRTNKDQNNE